MFRKILKRCFPFALALAATPAAAEWREASTEHFLIYADSRESWLREFAGKLERFDSAMRFIRRTEFHPDQKSNRVVVYVVSGQDAIEKLCGKCGGVAGFYVPRVGGSLIYTARTTTDSALDLNSDTILFHEYSHHFMLENFASAYPKWFIEGFAEFNGTALVAADGSVTVGRPALHRAYGILELPKLPIETLLVPPAKLSGEQTEVFYGRSWLLTHMLTFDAARANQLGTYLRLINQGKPNLEAARAAFGDLDNLARDLDAYTRKGLKAWKLPADRIKTGPIALRVLSAGEAATMPVRMRTDRGTDAAQAKALVPEARRRSGAFPADPGAQEVLAEIEYDAGNDAEAEAAVDRALAVDPKRIQALLYKGRVRMRRAVAAKRDDAATWRDVRSWFVKANGVDANAAEPLMLFYQSYLEQGARPTANAAAGLLRAFELSPQDQGLRMLAARQLLFDDKPAEARRALLPLAYDPHSRGEGNFAAKLVEMIDRGTPAREVADATPSCPPGEKAEGNATCGGER